MAKVRIQARTADAGDEEQHPGSYHHKHAGALDILARVWKREGFVGWYQVCQTQLCGVGDLSIFEIRECKPKL